jgi:hypothetical protein
MSYKFRLATMKDEIEVKKLYDDHIDEVKPLGLYDKFRKFFKGNTENTLEMWVCIEVETNKIIAAFHVHICGDYCHTGSGLCHKDHRRLGPAKMARKLYRDIAIKRGCKYLVREHPVGAKHVRLDKIEAAGWDIKTERGKVTMIGDLNSIDKENQY